MSQRALNFLSDALILLYTHIHFRFDNKIIPCSIRARRTQVPITVETIKKKEFPHEVRANVAMWLNDITKIMGNNNMSFGFTILCDRESVFEGTNTGDTWIAVMCHRWHANAPHEPPETNAGVKNEIWKGNKCFYVRSFCSVGGWAWVFSVCIVTR